MKPIKVLLLDYSIDRSETAVIKANLPTDIHLTSLFIDTEESFSLDLINQGFTHVIHSGSAHSVNDTVAFTHRALDFIQEANELGIWQMGICFGHQMICRAMLGEKAVRPSPKGFEVGWKSVDFFDQAQEWFQVRDQEKLWQHHFDEVIELPVGSEILATNEHTQIQAYINDSEHLFGNQFHPEFGKIAGNNYFLKDRELLRKHHFDVDEIMKEGPSIENGKTFFHFFLNQ
ncbi:MAG: hypothetical protein JW729_00830 [Bacteroidales bacterium]|nr:hypothetical protein [Bacteroidales bacterium]